jgi:TfoX/Sxy family transcriptional regulator of competence genes
MIRCDREDGVAYDEGLAQRVREALAERNDLDERRMFGGLAFLLGGNLCAGVVKDELMVRVGPDAYAASLARPHARPMDFTGRPMKGLVYVAPEGLEDDDDLRAWVARGVDFAGSLPPK